MKKNVLGGTAVTLLVLAVAACDSATASDSPSAAERDGLVAGGSAGASGMRGDECRGTVGAITVEKVIVPSGASCILVGTQVQSDVEVKGNAAVRVESGARVGGNVTGAGSREVVVVGSRVNGNVQTDNTGTVRVAAGTTVGGSVQIKQGGDATVENATVDGDVQFEQNRRAVLGASNVVRGNFQVFGNTGGVTLLSNRVAQNLQCKENRPAPVGSGNTAGSKEDQCARL